MFSLCGLHFLNEIYCLFSDCKSNTCNNKCENMKKRIETTGSFTVETPHAVTEAAHTAGHEPELMHWLLQLQNWNSFHQLLLDVAT